VGVEAEQTAAPADEQPDGEVGNEESDRGLSGLLDAVRQEPVEDEDGQPEGEQGRGVAHAPCESELARPASGTFLVACDERRDRCQVIGVGRVAEPEEDRDGQHDHDRRAVGRRRESLFETEHRTS
jgi:hypothetical protein